VFTGVPEEFNVAGIWKRNILRSYLPCVCCLYLQEFNKKSNSLYTILRSSKLAGSQRAPFLRQFLLRLNYNSFFEVIICFYGASFLFWTCIVLAKRELEFQFYV
jgi:hypothetical protein